MGSVRKKGNTWYYTIEMAPVDGKRKRIERAATGAKTKKEAIKLMLEVEEDIKKGFNYVDNGKTSYADFLKMWMDNYVYKNLAYNSSRAYEFHIKNIIPYLGSYQLNQLSPSIIQDFVDSNMDTYSFSTLEVYLAVIKASLKYAVHPCHYIKQNPAEHITLKRKKDDIMIDKEKDFISPEKFAQILDMFYKDSWQYALLMIAYSTGMRKGELLALNWSDINLENKVIHITNNAIKVPVTEGSLKLSRPKTISSIRDISFSDDLLAIFKSLKKTQSIERLGFGKDYIVNNFVFKKKDGSFVNFQDVNTMVMAIKRKIDSDFHLHQLRHTHATMLVESGASLKSTMMRLGHSNVKTTMEVYTANTKTLQDESAEKFEEYINKLSAK